METYRPEAFARAGSGHPQKAVCEPNQHEEITDGQIWIEAKREVEQAMHRKKKGTLQSGKSHKSVKSRKQAIAIGLSEARKKGAKVPRKKKS
jgi:hypothetical protein